MRHALISELVTAGARHARMIFDQDTEEVPASRLADLGSRFFSDDADAPVVAAVLTNDATTVALVLGAIAAGAELVSLPVPSATSEPGRYVDLLKAASEHGLAGVVARDDMAPTLERAGVATIRHSDLGARPIARAAPGGFSLVQFTSGSSAEPRAIRLDDAALGANVAAILESVQPGPGDTAVSWLPLSHDMGLIGMLLTSIAAVSKAWAGGGRVVLLEPKRFLRTPSIWLDAISEWGGSFTAAPDFAFRLTSERGSSGFRDLSKLRCAIVGGEIVRAETLGTFNRLFAPLGLRPGALCPAYGMAELGLAGTMTSPTEAWQARSVSSRALAEFRVASVHARSSQFDTTRLVASGQPLRGYEIRSGARCDEIGELFVRGPSIGREVSTGNRLSGPDGWLATGDLGFTADEYVFVCGRSDDCIVAHGRNIHAPTVEFAVSGVPGVRPRGVAVVGTPVGDWAVIFERLRSHSVPAHQLVERVRRVAVACSGAQPSDVVLLRRGHLPLTASGKLRRHEVRRRYARGEFDAVT